jgi:hypothetical protein
MLADERTTIREFSLHLDRNWFPDMVVSEILVKTSRHWTCACLPKIQPSPVCA